MFRKYTTFIAFISLGGPLACAAPKEAQSPKIELEHLRAENLRLEQELMGLREVQLKADRQKKMACVEPAPEEEAQDTESEPARQPVSVGERPMSRSESPTRPELPIVRLSPVGNEALEPIQASNEFVEPEEPIDESTRPVLKVTGEHEAWVYHRPITEQDREAPEPQVRVVSTPQAAKKPAAASH